jgi:WD40 repeat protein
MVVPRIMPKRPCALVITEGDLTIISADKFGDVYSLPLIPTEPSETPSSAAQTPEPTSAMPFVPAANEFTIHSQRNRKALENQKRQSNRPSGKLEPTFEHNLLLGHVSLLTDMALATSEGRKYIITADRDEHIRVSRGMPQAHIIEGFCLGHTDFITRLCVPENRSYLLVSGGGDDEIFLWDWRNGQLVSKGDLKKHFEPVRQELDVEMARRCERRSASEREKKRWEAEAEVPRGEVHEMGREEKSGEKAEEFKDKEERITKGPSKPAVSGICYTTQPVGGGFQNFLIIACEG